MFSCEIGEYLASSHFFNIDIKLSTLEVSHFFSFNNLEITVEIMKYFYPYEFKEGKTGSMPTIFWGDMYGNFGLLGVLIPPFFVGYFLFFINYNIKNLLRA